MKVSPCDVTCDTALVMLTVCMGCECNENTRIYIGTYTFTPKTLRSHQRVIIIQPHD